MKFSGRNVLKSFLVPRKVLEIGLSSSVLPYHNGAGSISIINTMKIISIESCLFILFKQENIACKGNSENERVLSKGSILKMLLY